MPTSKRESQEIEGRKIEPIQETEIVEKEKPEIGVPKQLKTKSPVDETRITVEKQIAVTKDSIKKLDEKIRPDEQLPEEKQPEIKSWRKPKGEVKPQDITEPTKVEKKEAISLLHTEDAKKETLEKVAPGKPEQMPWNKQEITLKKTRNVSKDIVKGISEDVSLKPVRRESKFIETPEEDSSEKSTVEDRTSLKLDENENISQPDDKSEAKPRSQPEEKQPEIKSWRKPKGEVKPQDITEPTEVEKKKAKSLLHTEDAKKEKLEKVAPEKVDEIPVSVEDMNKDMPIKPKQRDDSVTKKAEPIPWNKQEITLKKTRKVSKDIVKEISEDVSLKPVRRGSKFMETPKEDSSEKVTVEDRTSLKWDKNENISKADDKSEVIPRSQPEGRIKQNNRVLPSADKDIREPLKEQLVMDEITETKSWREPRKEAKPESNSDVRNQPQNGGDKDVKTSEETKLVSDEVPIPWNKHVLHKAKQEKNDIVEKTPENVELKESTIKKTSAKKEKQQIIDVTEGTTDTNISEFSTKEVESEFKEHIPAKESEIFTPEKILEKDQEPEIKDWRQPKKPIASKDFDETVKEEAEKSIVQQKLPEEILKEKAPLDDKDKIHSKPEKTPEDKDLPWNKEVIKLKKTPKIPQQVQKEEIETVSLKPLKGTKSKPGMKEVSPEVDQIPTDDETKRKITKRRKTPEEPKMEEPKVEEPKVEEPSEKLQDIEKLLPESVIVETVTEIEDTVILKVDEEDKSKPSKAKATFLSEEPKLEEIKLRRIPQVDKVKEDVEIEKITLKHIVTDEIPISEITKKPKQRTMKPKKTEDLPEIEDAQKYVPELPEKIEFEKSDKEEKEKPSTPWRQESKSKDKAPIEEKAAITIGKGKLPDNKISGEDIKLKPVKKAAKPKGEMPEKSKPCTLQDSNFELKDFDKQEFDTTSQEKEEIPEVVESEKIILPEDIRKEEEALPKPTAPWRRTPKQQEEETPEVKEWPKGKRKPLPEQENVDIKLKPISKEKPQTPEFKIETEVVKRETAIEVPLVEHDDTISLEPDNKKMEKDVQKRKKKKGEKQSEVLETKEEQPEIITAKPITIKKEETVELETSKPEEVIRKEEGISEALQVKGWRRGKKTIDEKTEFKDIEKPDSEVQELESEEIKHERIPLKDVEEIIETGIGEIIPKEDEQPKLEESTEDKLKIRKWRKEKRIIKGKIEKKEIDEDAGPAELAPKEIEPKQKIKKKKPNQNYRIFTYTS
ncbi:hypothetical protein JTB14_030236 [Gonioctena quinquepunctata]|nr:hypothetical protein JTB14_030236 [Gonioctena quinquepunctata]